MPSAAGKSIANTFLIGYAYGVFCGVIGTNIVFDAKRSSTDKLIYMEPQSYITREKSAHDHPFYFY